MPLIALVALFIAVPLLELYVILRVGDAIGAGWTVALLAADSLLGALLLRAQGRVAWRRFNQALAERRMPHREIQDGVLVIFGAAFLLTPGFITDVAGLLMLLPPTRALIRTAVMRRVSRRMTMRVAAAGGPVEGTATEHREPPDNYGEPPTGYERPPRRLRG